MGWIKEMTSWERREILCFSERLTARYSVLLLSALAALLALKQLTVQAPPISCWTPAQFNGQHVDFTNKVCYTSGLLYNIAPEDLIPDQPLPYFGDNAHANRRIFTKLHWYFIFQAFLLALPALLWRAGSHHPLVPLRQLLDTARDVPTTADRRSATALLARRLGHFLWDVNHSLVTKILTLWGNYLSFEYLLVQILNVAVAAINVKVALSVFGRQWTLLLEALHQNVTLLPEVYASPHFPLRSLCEFDIRRMGNIQRYTVECTFWENPQLSALVVFVGCWMMLLLAVNVAGLVTNLPRALFAPCCCKGEMTMALVAAGGQSEAEGEAAAAEMARVMGRDGTLMAALVARAAGNAVATEMIAGAWEFYKEQQRTDGSSPAPDYGIAMAPVQHQHQHQHQHQQQQPGPAAVAGVYPKLN